MTGVLRGTGLRRTFGARVVVEEASLVVARGEVVGLFGPNGAGKTTLLRMLSGELSPDAGRVELDGHDVTGLDLSARARRGLGYLAQEPTIFRSLSARENVMAYLEVRGLPRADRRVRADELLGQVGLSALANARASTLSGGERRRLEVARTLALDPLVVVCDEPFTGVDPRAGVELATILTELARRSGVGILLCDHAVEVAMAACDRVYLMARGTIVAEGPPDVIREDEETRGAYLAPRPMAIIREHPPGHPVGHDRLHVQIGRTQR